jgi:predicted RNA-binding Zn-ribbon protein involved in translation (DUF1610 family)
MDKCPGGELRHLTAEDVTCQSCGIAVEMFSDEQKRKCPECGHRITRETAPACAAWCAAAKECLGAERYDEFVESGVLEADGSADGGDAAGS